MWQIMSSSPYINSGTCTSQFRIPTLILRKKIPDNFDLWHKIHPNRKEELADEGSLYFWCAEYVLPSRLLCCVSSGNPWLEENLSCKIKSKTRLRESSCEETGVLGYISPSCFPSCCLPFIQNRTLWTQMHITQISYTHTTKATKVPSPHPPLSSPIGHCGILRYW